MQQNSPRLTDEYEMAISAYAASQMTRGGATDLLNRLDRSGTKVDSGKMIFVDFTCFLIFNNSV